VPESSRHLIEKQQYDEAWRVLQKLHFDGSNDAWIYREYTEIRTTIEAEKALRTPGWGPMFTVPQWRTRLLYVLCCSLIIMIIPNDLLVTASPSKHSPR
jgi:hypothetical protein